MRINKFLAEAGVCSRRAADELIMAGVVRVNGQPVQTPGIQVEAGQDCVEVHGKTVTLPSPDRCYVMLNKPVQVVSTVKDPQGRRTVIDCLPKKLLYTGPTARRLYPVGRLDFFSEGLILLTDDGELTQRLIHPRHHISKVYQVVVRGEVTERILATMRRGMTLSEGIRLAPVQVRVLRQEGSSVRLEMVLHQGVNRQIRRMCRDTGLTVLRLIRTAQGPVTLGNLSPGAARLLTPDEISSLRRAAGMPN